MIFFRQKILVVISALFIISGCAPKYTITYEVTPTEKNIAEFTKNKLGVLVFEDSRPRNEVTSAGGNTMNLADHLFEKEVPDMINDLTVNHFDKNQGSHGSIVRLPQKFNDLQISNDGNLPNGLIVDYLLVGNIKHFTAHIFDDHYGARMTGSFFAGLTVVGIVFMPLIMAGDVDLNSEIEFDNLLLIKVDGPQILWKGKVRNTNKSEIALFSAGVDSTLDFHAENTKKSIQSIYNNIMLASELGFPQKYSIEDSKKILSHIKMNGSLSNLSF